jgi:FAD synthase
MKFIDIVQKGGGYGRKLGFPTANIPLADDSISGIYAAKVRVGGGEYNAAVYADQTRKLLEAHLLHFNDNLYGMEIEIELVKKIREDRTFEDEADARAQIAADVRAVEEYYRMP